MRAKRRHQVVITLMIGAEPWVRIEAHDQVLRMPASVSLLEVVERLQAKPRRGKPRGGELLVRARLDQVLKPR